MGTRFHLPNIEAALVSVPAQTFDGVWTVTGAADQVAAGKYFNIKSNCTEFKKAGTPFGGFYLVNRQYQIGPVLSGQTISGRLSGVVGCWGGPGRILEPALVVRTTNLNGAVFDTIVRNIPNSYDSKVFPVAAAQTKTFTHTLTGYTFSTPGYILVEFGWIAFYGPSSGSQIFGYDPYAGDLPFIDNQPVTGNAWIEFEKENILIGQPN